MATVNLNEFSDGSNAYVPTGMYKMQCCHADKEVSKAGNPMLVLSFEIVEPSEVTGPEGETLNVAGVQVKDYYTLIETGFPKIKQLHKQMSLPLDSFDPDSPDLDSYIGKTLFGMVSTDQKVQKNEITGEAVIDPRTGKKVVKNQRRFELAQS